MRLDLTDMLYSLSFALDRIEGELLGVETGHGKRVAALSLIMGKEAGFEEEELRDFVGCCILHDNALTEFIHEELSKRPDLNKMIAEFSKGVNVDDITKNNRHSVIGERNIELMPFRTDVRNIILYHHENADGTGAMGKTEAETGLKSQMLHMADIVDMRYKLNTISKEEFDDLTDWVKSQSGKMFSKEAVDLFQKAIDYDKILYLQKEGDLALLNKELKTIVREYSDEEIHNIAGMFAGIVDYKSEFTRRHSLGVADKAEQMAHYYGFDPEKTTRYYFAGAMHDIGKLVVSNDILEKPGKLTAEEYTEMKNHSEATYYILSRIKEIPDIIEWASNHHEKLNGTGYSRGLKAEELSFEDRLMACIDIYQALTEKRPYKDGMSHEKTISIMTDMVEKGELDGNIVKDMDKAMGNQK